MTALTHAAKSGKKWNPTDAQLTEFRRLWRAGGRNAVTSHFSISQTTAYYWAEKLGVPRNSYNLRSA